MSVTHGLFWFTFRALLRAVGIPSSGVRTAENKDHNQIGKHFFARSGLLQSRFREQLTMRDNIEVNQPSGDARSQIKLRGALT